MAQSSTSTNKVVPNTTSADKRTDLVAYWSVPLLDGIHTIEFEHGTTTGKRVLRIDGKEVLRKEWLFKLVGDEKFALGKQQAKCELRVDPMPHFMFSYSLLVDGKPLEKFTEKQSQLVRSWTVLYDNKRYKIIFEKQTLNLWINGHYVEGENLFVHDGAEIRFELEEGTKTNTVIKAVSADKKQGVVHQLYLNGRLIEEDTF